MLFLYQFLYPLIWILAFELIIFKQVNLINLLTYRLVIVHVTVLCYYQV